MLIPRRHIDTAPGELSDLICPWSALRRTNFDQENVTAWEYEFASFVGRKFGIATGSGRFAMRLILSSMNLPSGGEVIIPAYTLKDLLPLISNLGLKPVPADIDPEHWNISAETIRPKLSGKTVAILTLHLFGNPCPMPEIMELARQHSLPVIEDCAHSAGSSIAGRATGSFGEAAFFSFESIKPINTYGGGMVVTDNSMLAGLIQSAAGQLAPAPGISAKARSALFERIMFASGLARLPLAMLASPGGQELMTRLYRLVQPAPSQPRSYSPLQAELGHRRLATLEERIRRRRRQAAIMRELLPADCRPQSEIEQGAHNYYFYVVQVPGEANELRRRLLRHGFDAGVGAEIADDCAALLNDRSCPESARLFRHALHLPLHEKISASQLERLAQVLHRLLS